MTPPQEEYKLRLRADIQNLLSKEVSCVNTLIGHPTDVSASAAWSTAASPVAAISNELDPDQRSDSHTFGEINALEGDMRTQDLVYVANGRRGVFYGFGPASGVTHSQNTRQP